MTPSVTGVPVELQELPQAVLQQLRAACGGDWRRVEVHGPGDFTVHNQPRFTHVQLPDVRPAGGANFGGGRRRRGPGAAAQRKHVKRLAASLAEEYRLGVASRGIIKLSEEVENLPHERVQAGIEAMLRPQRVIEDPDSAAAGEARVFFHRGELVVHVSFANIVEPRILSVEHSEDDLA